MTTLSGTPSLDKVGPSVRFAHGAGFWMIAVAFLTTMAFSTVPTPLYAIYQRRDGFPTLDGRAHV